MRHAMTIGILVLFTSGCNGEAVFAGNLAVATVPCVLLYLTLNLKRER